MQKKIPGTKCPKTGLFERFHNLVTTDYLLLTFKSFIEMTCFEVT